MTSCPVTGPGSSAYVHITVDSLVHAGLTPIIQDLISDDPDTHGAFFVPIILGSDKTTVSVATGQQEYHPVYLSVGNVHNHTRRAHKDALVLIGFLPIPKGNLSITIAR